MKRLLRITALTASATVAAAQPASAQVDLLGPGAGFVSLGAARLSTGELDEWLAARDYPTFGTDAISIGLGGYRVLANGMMLGAEAQGFIIGDQADGDGEMGLGGGYATLGLGYAFELSPRLRVYPRVGAGPGGMALWFEEADTLEFEEVVENRTPAPQRAPNLSRDGLVLDLGAGVEFISGGPSGLLVAVRAGYLTGPFSSTWQMYEHDVRGGPDASISGPYVRLALGWAWRR